MKLSQFDKTMVAMTFAEAGEHDTAKEFLAGSTGPRKALSPVAKKKPVLTMIIFGAISLTGYVVLMGNQQLVTDTFTKGGWYAALPVGAALVFSFVHGAFSSDLLTVLGLAAKK
jgi:hypothetical protein